MHTFGAAHAAKETLMHVIAIGDDICLGCLERLSTARRRRAKHHDALCRRLARWFKGARRNH